MMRHHAGISMLTFVWANSLPLLKLSVDTCYEAWSRLQQFPQPTTKETKRKIKNLIFVFLLPLILFTDNERANNKSLFESENNHMIKNQHKTLT